MLVLNIKLITSEKDNKIYLFWIFILKNFNKLSCLTGISFILYYPFSLAEKKMIDKIMDRLGIEYIFVDQAFSANVQSSLLQI